MMNDCAVAWIHDSLPDYLHGTLNQRERLLIQAHLALCEECRSDLAILERSQAAMIVAPVIDVARVVSMLPPPPVNVDAVQVTVRAIPGHHSRPGGWRNTGRATAWRIAAVALLTVGTLSVLVTRGGHWAATDGIVAAPVMTAPLAGSGDSALLAGQTDLAAASSLPAFALTGGLSDLSEDALDALLMQVDAVEALPLLDPPTMGSFNVTEQTGAE